MMRIDLFGAEATAIASSRDLGAPAKAAASQASASAAIPKDTATLSPGALAGPTLVSQALSASQLRQAKVEALRQAVSNAAYNVDPSLVAEALLRSFV